MGESGFTHLHVHSEYSLLDGAASVKKLVQYAKELHMDALAITDHGNMFGAVAFYRQALAAGIKPIIGIEAYIAPGARTEREAKGIADASFHLLLLAENLQGYKNLLKLASIGYLEGFYYRPRIDREVLEQYKEGLICTSACLSGEIPSALAQGDMKRARQIAEYYLNLFGPDRFFIEIQWHCSEQNSMTPMLADLANEVGVPLVATNDVHFLKEEDYQAHEALICIGTGKTLNDEKRMKYPTELYLKSPDKMRQLFSQFPSACDNTIQIADRCNIELDFSMRHAPVFKPPKGKNAELFLEELCLKELKKKYPHAKKQVKDRLQRELEVIRGKNFASYFLIVWDFVRYAREQGIPANPRGSGVGTLVGYLLGISNIDPLSYGLLFERFMDPERNDMPDIDIDICQIGRAAVIDYVRKKYGHVAQIITFGTMKARGVIRDVCRVMSVPLADADRLAKMVPETLGVTLEQALEQEPKLNEWCRSDEKVREVIEIGKRLEGLARHASVHAAGVVVADEPLDNFLPLYKTVNSDEIITQFDGPTVEKVGLLKMDFLGLRTLTTIERARQLVKLGKDIDIDPDKIDLEDKNVLQLFTEGRTKGVFQFESAGMRDLLQNMRPDRIEDLIAANALYRPGPMTLIPDYNSRKHGQEWSLPHPLMEDVLRETYGIMVYQEQVMQILNLLGELPLARAYRLIKAISKKKHGVIRSEAETFIEGCVGKGIEKEKAKELFELIQRFAGYGFNKSHSTQYAILAFQTAYFKQYYPTEFMAALLTFEMGSTDKIAEYIDECKQMGIKLLPPDVNESFTDFTVIYDKDKSAEHSEPDVSSRGESIRFGLAAVKGVGERAVLEIIRARQENGRFESLFDMCEFVDSRIVNKGAMEALIKAGALDTMGGYRSQMLAVLEDVMSMGSKLQQDKRQGQLSFFDAFESDELIKKESQKLPNVPAWPKQILLQYEKEVLGFYVTDHPLAEFAEKIQDYSNANSDSIKQKLANREVIIGGMLTRVRFCVTKNGRGAGARMAMFTLEDAYGSVDGVIFPDSLALYEDLFQADRMVFLRGNVDHRREEPSIRVSEVFDMTRAEEDLTKAVNVKMPDENLSKKQLKEFKTLCQRHPGRCPVYVELATDKNLRVILQVQFSVRPDADFRRRLNALVGLGNCQLISPNLAE